MTIRLTDTCGRKKALYFGFKMCPIIVVMFLFSGCYESDSLSEECRDLNKVTQSNTDVSVLRYHPKTGLQVNYNIKYRSDSYYDFKSLFDASKQAQSDIPLTSAQNIRVLVKAHLSITTLSHNENKVYVLIKFSQPEVNITLNNIRDKQQADEVEQELLYPMLAAIDKQGGIYEIRLTEKTGKLTHGFIRAMLGMSQIVLPENGKRKKTWQSQESDPNGVYISNYKIDKKSLNSSSKLSITKVKQGYIPVLTGSNGDSIDKTINSKGKVSAVLDVRYSIIDLIVGSETQSIVIANKEVARADNFIRLNYLHQKCLSNNKIKNLETIANNIKRETSSIALYSDGTTLEQREFSLQKSELGHDTLASLLEYLSDYENNNAPVYNEISLYLKFKALIYIHPKTNKKLADYLKVAEVESPGFKIISASLSSAGSVQAQQALINVINARINDLPAMVRLIPALGVAKQPHKRSVNTLIKLLNHSDEEVVSSAILNLGVFASNLAKSDPVFSNYIVSVLLNDLKKSKKSYRIQSLLLAIGNTGHHETVAEVIPFTKDKQDLLIRLSAIYALGLLNSVESAEVLTKLLLHETDDDVRAESARALSRNNAAERLKTYITAMQSESSSDLRVLLLEIIAGYFTDNKDLHDLFVKYSEQDDSEVVRNKAKSILRIIMN